MKLLVDTQALIWFIANDPRLSGPARRALEDLDNDLTASIATFWEMAIKISMGRLHLPIPFGAFMREGVVAYGISIEPILPAHAEIVASMPFRHKDPFDRMIVAQAKADAVPVVSSDAAFDAYGITRI